MLNYIVVGVTAVLGTAIWEYIIDPYLERRPSKAVFIRPRGISKRQKRKEKRISL